MKNVLSLFDGISCGQVALNRAGISLGNYYASEIHKPAMIVTQHNYPDTIQLGDVTKIKGSDLSDIDLLIGGSPCQGFSFCGKQLNFEDPRSKLFFDFVRLIKELKPKYFLLENVRMKKESEDIITKYLEVEPVFINSALFSAQDRKRLYWTNIPIPELPESNPLCLADILENEVPEDFYLAEERLADFVPKGNVQRFSIPDNTNNIYVLLTNSSEGYQLYDIHGKPCTAALPGKVAADIKQFLNQELNIRTRRSGLDTEAITLPDRSKLSVTVLNRNKSCVIGKLSPYQFGRVFSIHCKGSALLVDPRSNIIFDPHTNRLRRLTAVENERLQTLDDNYTQCLDKAYPRRRNRAGELVYDRSSLRSRLLGNGWTVDVIKHILEGLPDDWKA